MNKYQIERENVQIVEKQLIVLLHMALNNDSKRWFAGIRKPSKYTRSIMDDLCKVYAKREDMGSNSIEDSLIYSGIHPDQLGAGCWYKEKEAINKEGKFFRVRREK